MEYLTSGLVCAAVGVVLAFIWMFIKNYRKALKDPDVILASKLGMSMQIYNDCKEVFEERQAMFKKGMKEIDYKNIRMPKEQNLFRKYEQYRYFKKEEKEWNEMSPDLQRMMPYNNPYKKDEYFWIIKQKL